MTVISCAVGLAGRARVWLDELPVLPEAHHDISFTLDLDADPLGPPGRSVCLEVALPRGARQLYGLLGAEHLSTHSSALHVVVPVASKPGPVVQDALTGAVERAYSGLTHEYGQAVITALATQEAPAVRGTAGILQFSRAAHGMVGSAPIVFRALASLVVALMFTDASQLEPTAISRQIAASFNGSGSGVVSTPNGP